VERDLAPGTLREQELPLVAATYLVLEIVPVGLDIDATLLDPEERVVAAADGRTGPGNPKVLSLVTNAPGTYRLRVAARGPRSGHYEVAIRALRPTEKGDEIRLEAAKRLAEGRRLRSQSSEEARKASLAQLTEALSLWQSVTDGTGEADALAEIGSLYADQENYQEALRWHQRSLARAQESGYADGKASGLGNIANCYRGLANYKSALDAYQQSILMWKEIGSTREQAFALQGLGRSYLESENLQDALGAFNQALALEENEKDIAEQAHALSGIGIVYLDQGKISEAWKAWEKALEFSRAVGDSDSEGVLENNLAGVYYRYGQLQKAIEAFTALIERGGSANAGVWFCNLGAIYLELGDFDKALDSYQRGLAAYRKTNAREQTDALVGIGSTLQRMGNPQAALQNYEEARKLLPQGSWLIDYSESWAKSALGRHDEALRLLARALSVARAGGQRSSEDQVLLAMGVVYRALGNLDQAADCLQRAIALGEEIEYPSIVTSALLQSAMIHRERGELDRAQAEIEKALGNIESTRTNIAGQNIRTGYLSSKRSYYEFYVDLLMQRSALQPEGSYRSLAFWASERARARGLLDLLAEGRIDVGEGLSDELRNKEGELAAELAHVQTELGSKAPSPERAKELKDHLGHLHERQERLDWEIRNQNRRYSQVRYPVPLKPEEIQRDLDGGTALLEYVLGKQGSTLFVLTRDRLSSYALPGFEEIARQVRRLRPALEKDSLLTKAAYADSAFQLYQMLVAPAAAALVGKTSLVIVPDRDLYYIPFEALLTEPAGGRPYAELPYLLRAYSIAYTPSASVSAGLRQPRPPASPGSQRLVAFAPFSEGGEDAGAGGEATSRKLETSQDFPLLPGSRREISGIGSLYPGSSLELFGAEATEENVKQNPAVSTARRLHFATHAQLDERYPEYSSLILARSRDSSEDGYLRVQEIFNLKLTADLVVLSACQTALGKEVTGEGLIGLTRAFFYAGVPSLVVSLWNVTDGPTPDLMLSFYQELDRLQDKSRALRNAKLAMISRQTYAHPSYWAPFILIGEPK
jgi:CHAT domain-containing protein/Tfp pilus assembly protein PilF